jgi:hypothetical protein
MEVPLPELSSLLRRFIHPNYQKSVEGAIVDQLTTLFDYQGTPIPDFIINEIQR